ncbi:hypothetical protein [Streptomyces sp. NPDC020951]
MPSVQDARRRLTSLSADWQELAQGYDIAVQLRAMIDGLLPPAT